MNKFTILFLTLFLALPIAMKADSAKEKKDDSRYLKVELSPRSRRQSYIL